MRRRRGGRDRRLRWLWQARRSRRATVPRCCPWGERRERRAPVGQAGELALLGPGGGAERRWRALEHVTLSPSRIGGIARAALVLNGQWK